MSISRYCMQDRGFLETDKCSAKLVTCTNSFVDHTPQRKACNMQSHPQPQRLVIACHRCRSASAFLSRAMERMLSACKLPTTARPLLPQWSTDRQPQKPQQLPMPNHEQLCSSKDMESDGIWDLNILDSEV